MPVNTLLGEIGVWLSPLLLLPGAALLIMSTSARYARIHNEIHHLLEHSYTENTERTMEHLHQRSRLFRSSLVLLYLSVCLFATAGLLGAITSGWTDISYYLTIGLTALGIFFLSVAAFCLIRESMQSLEIIKAHIEDFKQNSVG